MRIGCAAALAAGLVAAVPGDAGAFCGFYVGSADQKLFNNATMVVLMRGGTRTVLSMQNNYQGPPEDFAMVVPVPVVLQKENVKTLPREVFDHVEALAAPRLVEYWEQDPCPPEHEEDDSDKKEGAMPAPAAAAAPAGGKVDLGVRVEARFEVGEYDVVILSAQDALGLDTWLRLNRYKIPEGAEPILRPYVQGGMKFFVAKVNVAKVRFENGMATLSPLRFHYDTDTFSLPVRLGLLNSGGTQDLIVHVLARGKRYEVANYPNATIPTNYDVGENAKDSFGAFYASLFDRTLAVHPGAVVTEYAWDASSCDPCPTPALEADSLATLGADVLDEPPSPPPPPPPPPRAVANVTIGDVASGNKVENAGQTVEGLRGGFGSCVAGALGPGQTSKGEVEITAKLGRDGAVREAKTSGDKGLPVPMLGCLVSAVQGARFNAPKGGAATVKLSLSFSARWEQPPPPPTMPPVRAPAAFNPYGFVLTRLHARYTKDALGQDLVFREAPPIEGGREDFGAPEQRHGAQPFSVNNFQGRYVIRHPWTGPIECAHPRRGVWGGPPPDYQGNAQPKPALKVAFAPRGQDLGVFLRGPVPELQVASPAAAAPVSGWHSTVAPGARGCGSCGVEGDGRALLPCSVAAFVALMAHERRRRRRGR
jgi:hypothetical protein